MKIIHLANFDGKGPALAAFRLHQALLGLGHDSRMLVPNKRSEEPTVELYPVGTALADRLRRRLRRARIGRDLSRYRKSRPAGLEDFSDDRCVHGGDLLHHLFSADILNVHMLRGFADHETFFRTVPARVPVVRTLHDLNFFTGGCHTAEGCTRYVERCGACPQLGSRDDDDLSRQVWERKRRGLAGVTPNRVHLVAPSHWLAGEARRSGVAHDLPVTVIPHGLDLDAFQPRDRDAARQMLGLEPHARVLLFVAEPISRRLKGFAVLAQALAGMANRHRLTLITVGSGVSPVKPDVPVLQMGYVGHERLLSIVYAAADLFVMPSSAESFGLTAAQALACGTPVVASDVGGVPEIVRPGVTGLLVPPHDGKALGTAITALLDDPARRRQMSENCRRIALAEYSLERQVRRNIELYQTMLAQRSMTATRPVGP
jgi:glycosyltransferase involved in cell wall biosynthesis